MLQNSFQIIARWATDAPFNYMTVETYARRKSQLLMIDKGIATTDYDVRDALSQIYNNELHVSPLCEHILPDIGERCGKCAGLKEKDTRCQICNPTLY